MHVLLVIVLVHLIKQEVVKGLKVTLFTKDKYVCTLQDTWSMGITLQNDASRRISFIGVFMRMFYYHTSHINRKLPNV